MIDSNTIRQWLDRVSEATQSEQLSSVSRLDAEALLCHVLSVNRSHLFAWPDKTLTEQQQVQLNALQQRCAAGEPLAYIVGEKEFWSLSLTVNPAVLIPRPETEMLVEAVLNLQDIGAASKILDAGTGSGAIAVALAHTLRAEDKALPKIIACDVSFDSLRIAQKNIDRHCRHDVQLVQADWLQGFDKQQFDVIVSNPPYIAEDDVHVAEDVRQHEPGVALFSIDNGLGAIQTLVKDSLKVGKSGSILLMEHGFMQAAAVQQLFTQHGYVDVITVKDYNGHDRITSGRCP